MSNKGKKTSYGATFLKDLIILVPFFLISFFALRPSVPSYDPVWVNFWAALIGFAMSATAWIALQMFKVVLADQQERAKESQVKK